MTWTLFQLGLTYPISQIWTCHAVTSTGQQLLDNAVSSVGCSALFCRLSTAPCMPAYSSSWPHLVSAIHVGDHEKVAVGCLLLESAQIAYVAEMRCSLVSVTPEFHLLYVEQPIWRGWT